MIDSSKLWKVLVATWVFVSYAEGFAKEPSFNASIRPLLAAKCYACHGQDAEAREADLRLDQRESAVDQGAIVPESAGESELIRRIESDDPDQRMPPPSAHDALTTEEIELLRDWINTGAAYSRHWAFVHPIRPKPPRTRSEHRVVNPIDRFVFAKLENHGRTPAPEADRFTLVRRVYLDLVGLPPTPEEADAFVSDTEPKAYERLVDRLLESERYGEHWAREWLDLARYSDTNGYEKDRPRSIWPYRDWVIRALNDDLPYDDFTVQQLAGDMLADASLSTRIATGFHRNTMLNEEGGIDPLEYRFYAMVDRVATTGTVWLGLTIGCAQCHTHKYDPITHTDYYRFMALMNNADEPDLEIEISDVVDERSRIQREIEQLERELPKQFPPSDGNEPEEVRRKKNYEESFQGWLASAQQQTIAWSTITPRQLETNLPRLERLPDGSILSTGDITKRDVFRLHFELSPEQLPISAFRLEALPHASLPAGGPGRAYYEGRKGDFFLSEFLVQRGQQSLPISSASHNYGKISIGSGKSLASNVFDDDGSTGWSTAEREGKASQLVVNLKSPITQPGPLTIELLFERHFAASLGRFRISTASSAEELTATDVPIEVEQILARSKSSWTNDDDERVRRYYLNVTDHLKDARQGISALREELPDLPRTMVMQERPTDNPRPTHRHHRGEYLSPKETVVAGLPALFQGDNSGKPPTNRLELARWLVSESNPLAARVAVNRAWQSFFGAGLVRSSGDFGTQAEPPTHPDLLDWLATEFIANDWSTKSLHRMIALSATYRQSSQLDAEAVKLDIQNRLLGRGPRFRVNAETVRDLMLLASGLLSDKMYGPSVYPPQPESVMALAFGGGNWKTSQGDDRYRRSLYTFSKRTAPFAAFTVFDAPTGEACIARRNRSNTPLQALTLLNDEMFLEMSRALAANVCEQVGDDSTAIATSIFRRLLTRPPRPEELRAVLAYQTAQQNRIEREELSADDLSGREQTSPERASWTLVARSLMNVDEAITKP